MIYINASSASVLIHLKPYGFVVFASLSSLNKDGWTQRNITHTGTKKAKILLNKSNVKSFLFYFLRADRTPELIDR